MKSISNQYKVLANVRIQTHAVMCHSEFIYFGKMAQQMCVKIKAKTGQYILNVAPVVETTLNKSCCKV